MIFGRSSNLTLIVTLSVGIWLAVCAMEHAEGRRTPIKTTIVTVSIPPQKFIVDRIGGDYVEVDVMLPPGQSPHTYSPSPKQVMRLQQSKAYFMISVPFETRFMEVMGSHASKLNLKHMFDGIMRLPVDSTTLDISEGDDDHGDEEGLGFDPHIWLDPTMVKQMARNTCEDLKQLRPQQAQLFQQNYDTLAIELDSLHRELSAELRPYSGRSFIVFHPAFGYFARAYGLTQIAIEHSGKEASAKRLAKIIDIAREYKVAAILVQEQFSEKQAQQIAKEIGCNVIKLDPLSGDYFDNMRLIAEKIAESCSR